MTELSKVVIAQTATTRIDGAWLEWSAGTTGSTVQCRLQSIQSDWLMSSIWTQFL